MSAVKVIELLSDSKVSWEDAARQAVIKASTTLHNIQSIYIRLHSADVENGKITNYRINAKVSVRLI